MKIILLVGAVGWTRSITCVITALSVVNKNVEMIDMLFVIAGLGLGVIWFTAITESSIFGVSCYHFGSFNVTSFCLNPPVYKGGLAVSGALVVHGLVLMMRKRGTPIT